MLCECEKPPLGSRREGFFLCQEDAESYLLLIGMFGCMWHMIFQQSSRSSSS